MEFVKSFENLIAENKIISGDPVTLNDQVLKQDFGTIYLLARKISSCWIGFLELKDGLNIEEFLNFCKEIAYYPKERIKAKQHILLPNF